MTKFGYEFGFWALAIVALATGVLMYQHAAHSATIVSAIDATAAATPPQRAQPDSPATGVKTPVPPNMGGLFANTPGGVLY